MRIELTFQGILTGKRKKIVVNDSTSPTGGYTQGHADRTGKDYEGGRAQELLGNADFWQWMASRYRQPRQHKAA